MKLISFQDGRMPGIGVLDDAEGAVIDLSAAGLSSDMTSFIELGSEGLQRAMETCMDPVAVLDPEDIYLTAPIPTPRRNIFCVGRNYHDHAKEFHESGFDASEKDKVIPDHPMIFTKATTSVIGPGEDLDLSLDPTGTTDYEGELGVVIGPGGRGIAKDEAYNHVYGYTIINDVTARTLQHRHKQWFIGKSLDGYCPMGPCLVTADEIGDVAKLQLTTTVNGEKRQDAVVADLIFDIPTLIETISAGITLLPGDIIATGTPVGVGIGFDPPVFLKSGDTVAVTVSGIGTLETPVI